MKALGKPGVCTSLDSCFLTNLKGNIKPVHVLDVPGHSRLRTKLDQFLPQAVGIVFVVDALDFLPNSRTTAEYLYDVLTKALVVKKKIPVLIVCNKVDKVTAHSMDFIRKQLEKEIDKLRASRSAVSAADIANEVTLGVQGQPFTFSQCVNKVTVAEASAISGKISEGRASLSSRDTVVKVMGVYHAYLGILEPLENSLGLRDWELRFPVGAYPRSHVNKLENCMLTNMNRIALHWPLGCLGTCKPGPC
eukprot:Gb_33922 [translate_table: standard]